MCSNTASSAEILDIFALDLPAPKNLISPISLFENQDQPRNSLDLEESNPDKIDLNNLINYHCLKYNLSRSATNSLLNILSYSKSNPNFEIPKNHNILKKYIPEISIETFFLCWCPKHFKTKEFICQDCNQLPKNIFSVPDLSPQFDRIKQKTKEGSLNFAFFTDGVDIFKKSKFCLWPLYLVSTDLSYAERYKLKNIVIVGIYYGKTTPPMQKILELAFFPYLINNTLKYNGLNLNIKFIIADKPARAKILNMQSHNSKNFCPLCLEETMTQTVNGRKHIYINSDPQKKALNRSKVGFSAVAFSAKSTSKPDYGVKGRCFFENLYNCDIISCNILDYMHGICGGVMKTLINLLFAPKILGFTNSLNLKHNIVDNCISEIKYPPNITKKPMKTSDLMVWQTKDYRNFFLFIFPLIKTLILDKDLFFSIMDLRKGLNLLLLPNPRLCEIQKSKECFDNFLNGFKTFFNACSATPNFHDLDHLPECVQKAGPLYEYSGFNFEHLNGRLKNFFRGNKRVDKQIIKKISNFIKAESDLFQSSILGKENPWVIKKSITSYTGTCGKITEIFLDLVKYEDIFSLTGIIKIFASNRALYRNKMVSTTSYNNRKPLNTSYFLSKDFTKLLEVKQIYYISHVLGLDLFFLAIYMIYS